jgi:CDP-glucose 4,6-dehydratase
LEHVVVSADFWRARTVLVTGHSGFKGSWLCLWLQSMGANVIGYSSGSSSGQATGAKRKGLFELARVGEGMRSLEGDVGDMTGLREVLADYVPEVLIHLAAQPLVRRSYQDPVGTYRTNVIGTVNLLEAVRCTDSVRVVVNVTTDKVYENRELERGYTEDDPLGGSDPYSSSKACSELVTSAYRRSFFGAGGPRPLGLASARSGNVIGGGDWGEDRLIPDVISAALEGRSSLIRNPGAVRPWQHVLNPLSGYLLLAERLWESHDFAEGWNFGPDEGDAKPVGWILERLRELWGEELRWEQDEGAQPHETRYLWLDSSKARSRLGWRPRWDLGRALASIVDWHKAVRDGQDARELVLAQIEAFRTGSAVEAGA